MGTKDNTTQADASRQNERAWADIVRTPAPTARFHAGRT